MKRRHAPMKMIARVLIGSLFVSVVASSHSAHAATPIDSTAALARARELRPYVSAGKPGPLWVVFDDTMRSAMGDSTRFSAAMSGIHSQVGTILEVVSEEMTREQAIWVYRATCRFEKAPEPLLLLIAIDPEGHVAGLAVRPQPPKEFASTKLDYVTKTSLHLPFHDEWYVVWGGRTLADNKHAVEKAQRFACDLLIVKGEATHSGDGKKLTDYYCYGAEMLAPADGMVVETCDSLPDQTPGTKDPAHPAGNHVVIDHGNGEFSFLAHLQPHSVRVKVGDRVKTGDVLGLCGNSGNTSEPHLHYHLQDAVDYAKAEGLPAPFVGLCVNGKPVPKAEPRKGNLIKPCP